MGGPDGRRDEHGAAVVSAVASPQAVTDEALVVRLGELNHVLFAPLEELNDRLSSFLQPWVAHSALVSWSDGCPRAPHSASGDEAIIAGVSVPDLVRLFQTVEPGVPLRAEVTVAGTARPVLAVSAAHHGPGALMVLVLPHERSGTTDADALVQAVWTLVEGQLAARALDGHPDDLSISRAAASERSRVATRLGDEQGTVLASLLGVLRKDGLDDHAARHVAKDLASRALVALRETVETELEAGAVPIDEAFARLEKELRPLTHHGSARLSFAAPESQVRLPAHAAQSARAITRSAVLALLDQDQGTRIRIGWKLDDRLVLTVRDDGAGQVDARVLATFGATAQVEAVDGAIEIESVPDWGTRLVVRLPLSLGSPVADDPLSELYPREREVLDLLAEGRRNREIGESLYISENTVKSHIGNILRKLDVHSRGEAAALARGSLAPPASRAA